MPGLFERIEQSLTGAGDWCSPSKSRQLAALVIALRPKTIVEIGVWCGASVIPMALAAKELGVWRDPTTQRDVRCTIHAVDPWSANASTEEQLPINAEWWGKAPHEWAYEMFLQRLKTFEVEDVVQVHRKRSDDMTPPAGIGLWHCDANHGPMVVDDVLRYGPLVRAGGVAILDDFHWEGGHVQRAGDVLESIGFRPLYEIDQMSYGRVYQRVSMR